MNKFKTIQTVLFATYSFIIIVVFTVLMVWFYIWSSDLLREGGAGWLDSMGRSIQEHTDSEIQKLSNVSLNVMYSNLVKTRFQRYLAPQTSDEAGSTSQTQDSIENSKELTEILSAIIGPARPAEQVYLYDFTSKVYGNGFDNGERTYNPANEPWFQPVIDKGGDKYISLPERDPAMSRFISSSSEQYSISLFRLFYSSYHTPIGIVEVKQYYDTVFKSMLEFTRSNAYQAQVLVFDDAGHIIFPAGEPAEQFQTYIEAYERGISYPEGRFMPLRHPDTGISELLSLHESDVTGWRTMIIVSEAKLLSPIHQFARQSVLAGFIVMLFAIVLSFVAAKRITQPIQKIHRSIRSLGLKDLGAAREEELGSGLTELDQLYWSFQDMSVRLKQSMDELLLAESQELQTRLVALQSQMNPHFLYNTLASIQAMAEENMTEQIAAMSENMSDFLRYISSEQSLVLLAEEAAYTEKYLEINQIRFGQKLQYSFDIDHRLNELLIPKLMIQPLTENALKFGTQQEPPWHIRVLGSISGSQWIIEVTDNGTGFTEESIAHLHAQIREIEETGRIPALKLDGMGLLNIYIRLKLTYGDNTIFDIANCKSGGASVRIGGTINGKGGAAYGQLASD